jgi:hypothetical protein
LDVEVPPWQYAHIRSLILDVSCECQGHGARPRQITLEAREYVAERLETASE